MTIFIKKLIKNPLKNSSQTTTSNLNIESGKSFLFLVFFGFLLASCGFRPIYKTDISKGEVNYEEKLAAIEVRSAKNRLHQKLKTNLISVLNPNKIDAKKTYYLDVRIDKSMSTTFINPTGSAGRAKVTLSAFYELKDIDNEVVAKGSASAKDDFDIEGKRFANYISQEEIELNLTSLIAQNIRDLLINDLYKINQK